MFMTPQNQTLRLRLIIKYGPNGCKKLAPDPTPLFPETSNRGRKAASALPRSRWTGLEAAAPATCGSHRRTPVLPDPAKTHARKNRSPVKTVNAVRRAASPTIAAITTAALALHKARLSSNNVH
jgi:hypothetical protein